MASAAHDDRSRRYWAQIASIQDDKYAARKARVTVRTIRRWRKEHQIRQFNPSSFDAATQQAIRSAQPAPDIDRNRLHLIELALEDAARATKPVASDLWAADESIRAYDAAEASFHSASARRDETHPAEQVFHLRRALQALNSMRSRDTDVEPEGKRFYAHARKVFVDTLAQLQARLELMPPPGAEPCRGIRQGPIDYEQGLPDNAMSTLSNFKLLLSRTEFLTEYDGMSESSEWNIARQDLFACLQEYVKDPHPAVRSYYASRMSARFQEMADNTDFCGQPGAEEFYQNAIQDASRLSCSDDWESDAMSYRDEYWDFGLNEAKQPS